MEQICKIAQLLCKRVGSPLSERVSTLLDQGRLAELQQLTVDPTEYETAQSYWADAMCVDLLRKAVLPTGLSTRRPALETFLETERDCHAVNQRMLSITENWGLTLSDIAFIDFLDRWKKRVASVMGRVPSDLTPRFSGGATTTTTRLYSTTMDKLSTAPELYQHSVGVVDTLYYRTGWGKIAHERRRYPSLARGNVFFTVPKNGLTDRACCKEAVLNVSYQLDVGRHLRERLSKTLNIDLKHGAALHQIRAREGSADGSLATIDLSSASDRWARELVRYLVPWDWKYLLNALRATHTWIGDKLLHLAKFSSMGNGFTFELETILFATLALTVQDEVGGTEEILCYGDDLIVPSGLAPAICSRLLEVGHRPNSRKTHITGPFRESCGGDYWKGEPVNTVKLEQIPEEPQHWISMANNLRRVAAGRPSYWALLLPVWRAVLEQLPHQIRRLRGPTHLGDAVIHDEPQMWDICPRTRTVRGYGAVVAKRPLFSRHYSAEPLAQLLYASLTSSPDVRFIPLREVSGYRIKRYYVDEASDWVPGCLPYVVDPRLTESRKLQRWAVQPST